MLKLAQVHLEAELRMDLDGVLATLVPDPVYVLWDGRRVEGMDAVRSYYTRMFERVFPRLVSVDASGLWVGEASVVAEGPVTMRDPGGGTATYTQVSVIPFRDGLIEGERVYPSLDFARLLDDAFQGWPGE
jgi:hypothetical protein